MSQTQKKQYTSTFFPDAGVSEIRIDLLIIYTVLSTSFLQVMNLFGVQVVAT